MYLFEALKLRSELQARRIRIYVATSVKATLWEDAEVFPEQRSKLLALTDQQRQLLNLFACRRS